MFFLQRMDYGDKNGICFYIISGQSSIMSRILDGAPFEQIEIKCAKEKKRILSFHVDLSLSFNWKCIDQQRH